MQDFINKWKRAEVHERPDETIFAAYGYDSALSDEETLAKLLGLNLERAAE